jgi:beta-phosphoglucomutase
MFIFDLDGVLVDTAKCHFLAWKAIAGDLGFELTPEHNERLKGVSRQRSLEILLEAAGAAKRFTDSEKAKMAEEKNELYVSYIRKLTRNDLLPGAEELLLMLRERQVKAGLGSASKNAPFILERLGLSGLFDVIIDGNRVSRPKPDPEVFLLASSEMRIPPSSCAVFEDAQAGIEAAIAAEMTPIGVGRPENLIGARFWVDSLAQFCPIYRRAVKSAGFRD